MQINFENNYSNTIMEQIYEFENSEELLSFRFKDTGIPMWMFIRSPLIRATAYVAMGFDVKKRTLPKHEKTLVDRYVCKNPFFTLKKDVVWAFFRYECMSVYRDGKVYDDLVMPFMRMLSRKGTSIMSGNGTVIQENRCSHPNWKRDNIFMDIVKNIKSKEVCKEDCVNIRKLLRYISEKFPMEVLSKIRKQMYFSLYYIALNHRILIILCEFYLKIVQPKLVIVSHGSYELLLNSAMIIACRKQNITTAEFQHAWVGKNHENFYYGDLIVKDKYCKRVLPDYLLTMGEFWNNQVNIPQKIFTIGYAKVIQESVVPQNDNILFAASCSYDQYEDILSGILPCIDRGAKIYFRLHPIEATPSIIKRFEKYQRYDCFEMANEQDFNYHIQKCRYVIVDGSTACYEALYLGRIVFNFDNAYSRVYGINELECVKRFGTAKEFLELWKERNNYESVKHAEFYERDWKGNFKKFLSMQGIKIERTGKRI